MDFTELTTDNSVSIGRGDGVRASPAGDTMRKSLLAIEIGSNDLLQLQ